MPRLDKVNRERAIGMLDAGVSQGEVARRFGVHRTTINRLVSRVRNTQTTDDRPRSGRPRVTSHVQDRFIRLRSLRNRFANAVEIAADLPFRRRISSKTVLRSAFCNRFTSTETIPWSSFRTTSLTSTFAMGSQVLKMDNSSVGTSPIQ